MTTEILSRRNVKDHGGGASIMKWETDENGLCLQEPPSQHWNSQGEVRREQVSQV